MNQKDDLDPLDGETTHKWKRVALLRFLPHLNKEQISVVSAVLRTSESISAVAAEIADEGMSWRVLLVINLVDDWKEEAERAEEARTDNGKRQRSP